MAHIVRDQVRPINPSAQAAHRSQMATRSDHRAVAAAILLTAAMALGAGAAQAAASGADDGRRISHGPTSSRLPLPAVAVATSRVQCTKVHILVAGETCASVARAARITVAEFVKLNPDITCAELPNAHGRWVCVRGFAIG
ncbi:unnamed protein product [Urochloa humidicola]